MMEAAVRMKILVVIVSLACTSGQICSSRFYCHNPEIKYMAMKMRNNSYLNITALSVHKVTDINGCQKLCNRDSRCFSANLNTTSNGNLECQLLGGNIFANWTMISFDANVVHLYTESICSTNPCQNNGTCVPKYLDGTYTCECFRNRTYNITGKHCEKISTVYETADFHWSMDSFPNRPTSGTGMDVATAEFISSYAAVREPGRRTPVSVCHGTKYCTRCINNVPCITSFDGCMNGFTYAFWFKLRKLDKDCTIIFNHNGGLTKMGKILQYSRTHRSFNYKVYTTKTWIIDSFGKNLDLRKWIHIVLSFDPMAGICAYFNGKLYKCENASTGNSLSNDVSQFRLGFTWDNSARCEIYMDDFAVWTAILNSHDVTRMFTESKA